MTEEQIKQKALKETVIYSTEKEKFAYVCGALFGATEATKEFQDKIEKMKKCLRNITYMAESGLHTKNELAFCRFITEAKDLCKE